MGVAGIKRRGEEERIGVRLPHFNYTDKKIIYIKQEVALTQKAIEEIKQLEDRPAITKGWLIDRRDGDSRIWEEDNVRFIPQLGPVYQEKFESIGITTIKQLKQLDNEALQLASRRAVIPVNRMRSFVLKARQAIEGRCTLERIDYRQAENPFIARFGENDWLQEVYKSKPFAKVVSIKVLLHHMNNATKEAFRDTEYAETYLWSHDALNQMIDKKCMKWMQDENILQHWVRPVLGVSDKIRVVDEKNPDTVLTSTQYKGRPPGDSPELMPCDNSLFRDLKCSLDICCALTSHLDKTDPRKFSKATPKELSKAIIKLWDPVHGVSPRPERILQDIARIPVALRKIAEADGGIVPGLADRNGHRKERARGKRVYHPPRENPTPKSFEEMGIHPDVVAVAEEFVEEANKQFDASKAANNLN